MRAKIHIETVKTWILTVLVLFSVVLSFKLWYSVPVYEAVDSSGYVGGTAWGPGKTVTQVLQPTRILVHLGDGRHAVILPDSDPYHMTRDLLRKATVSEFTPVTWSESVWESTVTKRSIEYDYGIEVQAQYLAQTLSLPSGMFNSLKARSLYLMYDADGNMRLLLKGDTAAYWAKVQIPADSLLEIWNMAGKLPLYALYGDAKHAYYLPSDKMKVPVDTYERNVFNTTQLMSSFFVDPSLTRRIAERDGSVILTDGSRGVQFSSSTKMIDYTNPSTDLYTTGEEMDHSLEKAIEFVNDHGGMEGTYLAVDGSMQRDITSSYLFRSYINGLPMDDSYFSIRVKMRGNIVFEMVRSVVYPGVLVKREDAYVLSGPALLDSLRKRGITNTTITDISLCYVPEYAEKDRFLLRPVWFIQRKGESPVHVDAVSGELWADNGGWLHGLE
ncbi:hypothetical protein DNHGIG_14000 [Collibacillus ludicampi]|uniref:Regulatory protein YycH domain-containing protein n=1 Tax=Collibacillus ludicampi TaxID=2771369 RepID=A0AAV4LDQ0_9BACL|nr:two-component system activity regulator YycH [Collibacillus ludicampi]GIM45851.1 hypothetical protein DNHGIG_14000 [Collibacillus ludicampi]